MAWQPSEGAPARLALLRLSALGDVSHVLPVVHRLRRAWPQTALTWVLGRREHALLGALPGVDFALLDKAAGWRGYRALARQLGGRHFEALLLMQVSMRAHLASRCLRADYRLGYDRVRGRDAHGLFVNARIAPVDRQHVLDAQWSFLDALGVPDAPRCWDLPRQAPARDWAAAQLPGAQPTLLISPASSVALRNWHAPGYAAVARYAVHELGMRVALVGGPSAAERALGAQIRAAAGDTPLLDLIGRDTLPRLLALLDRATVLLSPDSGPAHLAAIVDTPVIGLYAVSNPQRCGPYKSLMHCVDAYPRACEQILHRRADSLPWGTRVESPAAMALIQADEVCARLQALLAGGDRLREAS